MNALINQFLKSCQITNASQQFTGHLITHKLYSIKTKSSL